ncbi:MAG: hypothetical protein JSS12_08715, partial [Verrucomicrobia bacterium]|nr:hypothetical protein [Verrucomicrobiota bacterium]
MSSVANGGWVPQDDVPSVMSFWDCKINYNRCLGSGEWGTVYEVVPRPNNEQNYWSYLFPYVYDYIFRPSEPHHAVHCVKVLAPLPTAMIIVSAANKFLFIGLLAGVLFGRYKEKWSNLTARKYGLSTVKFSTTYSLLSQFKTKVNGHTFQYHAQKLNFNKQNKFHLRRAFVIFLQKLNNDKLSISDLHEKNIMYDKAKDCWEIVDGEV